MLRIYIYLTLVVTLGQKLSCVLNDLLVSTPFLNYVS